MAELRLTRSISLTNVPWNEIAELHAERTDSSLSKAARELKKFKESLEVLPFIRSPNTSLQPIITTLGTYYGVDTVKLSFPFFPSRIFPIRKVWIMHPWQNPSEIVEELHIKGEIYRDRTPLILWWLLLFISSACFSAALVGLTLYGISLMGLLILEPELSMKAYVRDLRLWVSLLCFLMVWSGLSGKAITNLFNRTN